MTVNYKELRTSYIFSDGSAQGENIQMIVSYKPYPRGGYSYEYLQLAAFYASTAFQKTVVLCVCVEGYVPSKHF